MPNVSSARKETLDFPPSLSSDIGARIREARHAKGMSLAQVGRDDLSRSFLSLVENGKSRISLRALSIVAQRLELPMGHFLGDYDTSAVMRTELVLDEALIALGENRPEEAVRLLDAVENAGEQECRAATLRGRALIALDRKDDAITVLREASVDCDEPEHGALRAEMSFHLGSALYRRAAYDEALLSFRRALDILAGEPEDPILLGKLTIFIGHVLFIRGDNEGAIAHYERAARLFQPVGDLGALGSLYAGLSRAYTRKQDLTNALRYSKMSVSAFQAHQDLALAAAELNTVAVRYHELGDLDNAETWSRDAIAQAARIGLREAEAEARSTLAAVLVDRGDLGGAAHEAETAVDLAPDGVSAARADAWLVQAKLASLGGDLERADELYRRVLETLGATDRRMRYAEAALAYSAVLRRMGNLEGAYELAVDAARVRATVSA